MTYKEAITEGNNRLADDPRTIFLGYGLQKGRALGTLKNVHSRQIIEMPVAENLMMSFAIGLALQNYHPVVFVERMDFLLNAMDAMVNHLDKIEDLSNREFSPKVIIRCVVGNKFKPLYTGLTHTQDFTREVASMVKFPVIAMQTAEQVESAYHFAKYHDKPVMLVEYKDLV